MIIDQDDFDCGWTDGVHDARNGIFRTPTGQTESYSAGYLAGHDTETLEVA